MAAAYLRVCLWAVTAAAVAGRWSGQRHTLHQSLDDENDAGEDDLTSCSCDCCDVVDRVLDEVVAGVSIKCGPALGHSADTCSQQCAVSADDRVLLTQDDEHAVEYQRFCLFECKPAEGPKSPVGTQCIALDPADVSQVVDATGNAMDPASIYEKRKAASFLRANAVVTVAKGAAPAAAPAAGPAQATIDPAAAAKDALQGTATARDEGKHARGQAQQARTFESKESQYLHKRLKGGANALDAIDDIDASADRARSSAEAAFSAAGAAAARYRGAKLASWDAALTESERQMKEIQGIAQAMEKKENEPHKKTWRELAAEAADKASRPFIRVVTSALYSARLSTEQARLDAKASDRLHAKSRAMGEEAYRLRTQGRKEDMYEKLDESDQFRWNAERLDYNAKRLREAASMANFTAWTYRDLAQNASEWAWKHVGWNGTAEHALRADAL